MTYTQPGAGAMGVAEQTGQDRVRLGQQFFASRIKAALEPTHNGSFVAINVENGDYFVHEQALGALHAARARYPERVFLPCPRRC